MKAHEESDTLVQATQTALTLEGVHSEELIIQQLQRVESQERIEEQISYQVTDSLYTLSCSKSHRTYNLF